jgi:hypothetical protein
MAREPRLTLTQIERPLAKFAVVQRSGQTGFLVSVADLQDEYGPTFWIDRKADVAHELVARKGAQQCAEGRGIVAVTRYLKGCPTAVSWWRAMPTWKGRTAVVQIGGAA